jgi:Xaa-Pro dipeptidase
MNTHSAQQSSYQARHSKLARILYNSGLDALVLNPGPSLIYLTGLHFHLMERPVVTFFTPHNPPAIVLPELEAGKTTQLDFPIQVFPYGEDPDTWLPAFRQAARAVDLDQHQVGVEPGRLRFLELRFLEAAAEGARFISAEEILAALRMQKDENELAAMRKAAQIAQQGLQAALASFKMGMTERDLAGELTIQLLRAGSDSELAFTPIVSGGPNSANPHATPTERPLQAGDLLVIDWGATYDGYLSDITRTFAIGEVEPELARIAQIVKEANQAGRAAVRPGALAEDVDHAARAVIEKAGYGQFFFHRTGHGLGMEGHEPPYMRAGNTLKLAAGMTFTVEPGIYIPERGGVRVEDDVAVTESGVETLTDLPRELQTLA